MPSPTKCSNPVHEFYQDKHGRCATCARARATALYLRKVAVKQVQAAGRPRPDACEVCGACQKARMHFDHDHETGAFRGWLCLRCNTALGMVGDRPAVLRKLAVYLENCRVQSDKAA